MTCVKHKYPARLEISYAYLSVSLLDDTVVVVAAGEKQQPT
jgi:hypothetical protein